MGSYKMADTGGRRNEKPLTSEQYREAKEYAISLGMPAERIEYSKVSLTGYMPGVIDTLVVGTDVLPLTERSKLPNDNISLKGVIAHEVVGHREANVKGLSQAKYVLEEAQASIRAARFAPGLDRTEKTTLIRDAIARLKNKGLSLRSVKDKLFIRER